MNHPRTTLLGLGLASCVGADPVLPDDSGDGYDVAAYDLRGSYDWDRGRLVATVEIGLTATESNLSTIVLASAVAEVTAVRDSAGRDLRFSVDDELDELTVHVGLTAGDHVMLAIDYEADTSPALRSFAARPDDPVSARALYTFSEPLGVPRWMPCHNRPDDRASFAVDMRMAKGEAMIANGQLERDEQVDGERRMRYATTYTLPPYLMAFAIGPFETTEGDHDELPIGTWRRPGVPGDHKLVVQELGRMIGLYESLLGPYPFEKYQLVLLPSVGGGIEHAGITFQGDAISSEPSLIGDLQLTAHELAHQWWGDHVTVHAWDDVWIKEGMATMMSAEALRALEDQSNAGTLLGDYASFSPEEPIRDPALEPEDKYTSGPYGRASWLLTQLRAVLGDDAFFATLRGLQREHSYGTITTDEFLEAFTPQLDDEVATRARNAVDAVDLPQLGIQPGESGGATLTLSDPADILVAPLELEWRRADGTTESLTMAPGEPLALTKQDPGDHLLLDPRDIHTRLTQWGLDEASYGAYYDNLVPLVLPEGPGAVAAFSALPGAHQRFALYYAGLPPIAPEQFPDLLAGLHSTTARMMALRAGCNAASTAILDDPAALEPWASVLTDAFTDDDLPLFGAGSVSSFVGCYDVLDPLALFPDEWADLKSGLEKPTIPAPRLLYLSRFYLDPDDMLDIWSPVARTGYSLRARGLAANSLYGTITLLEPEELAGPSPWRSLVLELLADHQTSEVLSPMIYSAAALASDDITANADLLAALDAVLHDPATWLVHARALCSARVLTVDEAGWSAFLAGLGDAPLSESAVELLAEPDPCN